MICYDCDMAYQYRREPITSDEADRLVKCCKSAEEKLVVWTLLETGLRVSEVAGLTKTRLTPNPTGLPSTARGASMGAAAQSGGLSSYPATFERS